MSNILRKVAQDRAERVEDLHLDLPVPTWDGDLIARFNVIEREVMEKFGNRRRSFEVDADMLAQALRELYIRDPNHELEGERMKDNDDFVRIEQEGLPVKFDTRLAQMFGQELETVRQVILWLFGGNAIAVGGFVVKVLRWTENTDNKVAESILGE